MTTNSKSGTPSTTKVSPDAPEGEGTKLARVDDPASLTKSDIQDITKDDGSDDAENSANSDAAENLKQVKADAKAKDGDDAVPSYFHGQGGAAGL